MAKTAETVTLKDFVREAITDVISGVRDAQEQAKDIHGPTGKPAMVNPRLTTMSLRGADATRLGNLEAEGGHRVEMFEFDVAVIAAQQEGEKAGIGVVLASIVTGGVHAESKQEDRSISRIKFSVPVVLPS